MTTTKPSFVFFFKRNSFLWGLHGQFAALTVCFLLVVQGHRLVFQRLQDWIKKANVWSFLKRMMDGLQMKEESVKKRPVTSYFSHTERKCPNIRCLWATNSLLDSRVLGILHQHWLHSVPVLCVCLISRQCLAEGNAGEVTEGICENGQRLWIGSC